MKDQVQYFLKKHRPHMSDVTATMYGSAIGSFSCLSVLVPIDMLKCRAQMMTDGKFSYGQECRSILR